MTQPKVSRLARSQDVRRFPLQRFVEALGELEIFAAFDAECVGCAQRTRKVMSKFLRQRWKGGAW